MASLSSCPTPTPILRTTREQRSASLQRAPGSGCAGPWRGMYVSSRKRRGGGREHIILYIDPGRGGRAPARRARQAPKRARRGPELDSSSAGQRLRRPLRPLDEMRTWFKPCKRSSFCCSLFEVLPSVTAASPGLCMSASMASSSDTACWKAESMASCSDFPSSSFMVGARCLLCFLPPGMKSSGASFAQAARLLGDSGGAATSARSASRASPSSFSSNSLNSLSNSSDVRALGASGAATPPSAKLVLVLSKVAEMLLLVLLPDGTPGGTCIVSWAWPLRASSDETPPPNVKEKVASEKLAEGSSTSGSGDRPLDDEAVAPPAASPELVTLTIAGTVGGGDGEGAGETLDPPAQPADTFEAREEGLLNARNGPPLVLELEGRDALRPTCGEDAPEGSEDGQATRCRTPKAWPVPALPSKTLFPAGQLPLRGSAGDGQLLLPQA